MKRKIVWIAIILIGTACLLFIYKSMGVSTSSTMEINKERMSEKLTSARYGEGELDSLVITLSTLDVKEIEEVTIVEQDETGAELTIKDRTGAAYCLSMGMDGYLNLVRKDDLNGEVLYFRGGHAPF